MSDNENTVNDVYSEPEQAKTENETDKKCPACGGVADYDPLTGHLKCPYCGNECDIEAEAGAAEAAFADAESFANCDWGTAKKRVICKSCGAETVYDALEIAGECPYCGSNQIMEAGAENIMKPGGVCPFAIDRAGAGARFTKWIKSKIFCPSKAKKMARPEAFKGVYLPYWTFDTQTFSTYTAECGRDHTSTDKDGHTHTYTTWHSASGSLAEFINDCPIPATDRHDTGILRKIEPFDTEHNVAYKPEYLAGFVSERYSVGLREAWNRAVQFIKRKLESMITSKLKREERCDKVASLRVQTQYSDIKYKYLLLPVWMSSFRYKEKLYQFYVNGQTGRVGGHCPVSPLRVAIAILIGLAIIGIIALFASQGG